jgi:hypothetical protein
MRKIPVEKAVGKKIAHDITRIIPGEFKGVGFKKGHLIREEDIPELLKLGKKYIYVMDHKAGVLHEDDAARRIARAISGDNLRLSSPSEGKILIQATCDGLLRVNARSLLRLNRMGNLIISTLKDLFPCRRDQTVAATRIIPLTISARKVQRLEEVCRKWGPVLQVLPFRRLHVGAVVTGSEIFEGLVRDGFDEYVGTKISSYGCKLVEKVFCPDDAEQIALSIIDVKERGAQVILITGGLSVDPDDVTKSGIRRSGARILFHGTPVLPGAMFLYAKLEDTVLLGLPACVYYHQSTVFDLVFPRVLAGLDITRDEMARMGHGGLCLNCPTCRYPVCPFGK